MNSPIPARRIFIKSAAAGAVGLIATPGLANSVADKETLLPEKSILESGASRFRKSFGELWDRIAACTLKYAEAMPEEHYDYKPVPEVRSFKEQMLHISDSDFWIKNYFSSRKITGDDYSATGKTKAKCVELMEASFENMSILIAELTDDELHTTVETFAGPLNRMEVLYFMRDHITHHRASTVPYLRLNGVLPPEYVGS